jgi:hypothetical protein
MEQKTTYRIEMKPVKVENLVTGYKDDPINLEYNFKYNWISEEAFNTLNKIGWIYIDGENVSWEWKFKMRLEDVASIRKETTTYENVKL